MNITIEDIIEPLSEYVKEELSGYDIDIEIFKGRIIIYSNTSSTLGDGTKIKTYSISIDIDDDSLYLWTHGSTPLYVSGDKLTKFGLNDPKSFEKLFCAIRDIITKKEKHEYEHIKNI